MVIKAKKQIINEKEIDIRSLTKEDAAAVLLHMKKTAEETHFLTGYPEEIGLGAEALRRQEQFLMQMCENPRCIFIGAFLEDELVGISSLIPEGSRQKIAHRGGICVSVREAVWKQGIGSSLLREIMNHGKETGYTQLELTVLEDNKAAYSLYRKFGFKVYGTLPAAVRLKDGTDITSILMYKTL